MGGLRKSSCSVLSLPSRSGPWARSLPFFFSDFFERTNERTNEAKPFPWDLNSWFFSCNETSSHFLFSFVNDWHRRPLQIE